MAKDNTKSRIAVNPGEADVVRLIYKWYLAGFGAKAICERLNHEGYRYRGKLWSKNRVLDIIGEESYAGRYYFNRKDGKTHKLKPREEWIEIPVEPIIDPETWGRAKALKEERAPHETNSNPAITGSKTLLTGLAKCGLCGAGMIMESAKGGRFIYYNCGNYVRQGRSTCPGQRIPAAELEQAILDHMASKLFTRERVKGILKGVYEELRKMDKERDGQRKSLIKQLDLVKARLTKQFEAIESGIISLQDIAERIKDLKEQRDMLEGRLEELRLPRAIPLHLFKDDSIEDFQKTIKEMFLAEDRDSTKRYLKLFIEKIVINLPRIDITCRSNALLAVLENKTAVRSGVLTADMYWLRVCNLFYNSPISRGAVKR